MFPGPRMALLLTPGTSMHVHTHPTQGPLAPGRRWAPLPSYRRLPVQPRGAGGSGRRTLRPSQQVERVSCGVPDLHTLLPRTITAAHTACQPHRLPEQSLAAATQNNRRQASPTPTPARRAPPHTPHPGLPLPLSLQAGWAPSQQELSQGRPGAGDGARGQGPHDPAAPRKPPSHPDPRPRGLKPPSLWVQGDTNNGDQAFSFYRKETQCLIVLKN